jgi:hypothetical protein
LLEKLRKGEYVVLKSAKVIINEGFNQKNHPAKNSLAG